MAGKWVPAESIGVAGLAGLVGQERGWATGSSVVGAGCAHAPGIRSR